jgi:hypothetical protein
VERLLYFYRNDKLKEKVEKSIKKKGAKPKKGKKAQKKGPSVTDLILA